jgi:hypothetical protein
MEVREESFLFLRNRGSTCYIHGEWTTKDSTGVSHHDLPYDLAYRVHPQANNMT